MPEVPDPDALFGEQIHAAWASGNDDGLNEQQLSIVDSAREIEQKLIKQVFGENADKIKTIKEERFWCQVPRVDTTFPHSGRLDVVHRFQLTALVCDLKSLAGDRGDPAANQQMRDYAVLAARGLMCNEVYCAIVQPLVTHTPVLIHYGPEELGLAEGQMFERVLRSNAPNAPRTAGEAQCKFCRAKKICNEYAQWSQSMLPSPVSLFDTPVANWTPEQCSTFLERRAFAKKWIEDCEGHMKALLKANPEAIPGWTLEAGDTRTAINDIEELHGRFLAAGGKTTDFMKCMEVHKTKLVTEIRAFTKLKGKGLNAKVEELLKGITTEKQNSPSLARQK